jgi:catechol 2,3-dioxygenase-like lactoylglutathione lyase family enzyme
MANEMTIPALPCRSIDETLEFYVALGFEITYKQQRPNNYGVVKYEDINLHFFTMKGYEPKDSYSTCLVLVPDLTGLHQVFSGNLRGHYGKLPVAGIPRISKLNNSNADKQLRFNVIDPGGNWVRFIQQSEQPAASADRSESDAEPKDALTKLGRAVHAADWLMEAQGEFQQAATMLDKALAGAEGTTSDRVKALVLRAAVAITLEDKALARTLLGEMRQIALGDAERAALADELQRAADLEAGLE